MSNAMFDMEKSDLKKLKRFMKESPKDFQKASSNVLTSLAFQTRTNDIKNLHRGLTIRDQRFLKSSLRVTKAKNVNINNQIAEAYSINRGKFTGWKEQEDGSRSKRKRSTTLHARGGNKQAVVKSKYRLKKSNKFYKPEQFQGRSLQGRFYFMMRVLGSRGCGQFIITSKIPTRRGSLNKGLYELTKGKKIIRIQKFEPAPKVKRYKWRSMSLKQLVSGNNIKKIWGESIKRSIIKYK